MHTDVAAARVSSEETLSVDSVGSRSFGNCDLSGESSSNKVLLEKKARCRADQGEDCRRYSPCRQLIVCLPLAILGSIDDPIELAWGVGSFLGLPLGLPPEAWRPR